MSRAAARRGGMDRQTLRDWVHAFTAHGPDGLINGTSPGRPPKLSAAQKQAVRQIVKTGPNPKTDGIMRWRCGDLRGVIKERYGVDLDEVSLGRLLKELGFAHLSARPRHPKQDKAAIETFKKLPRPRGGDREGPAAGYAGRGLVPRRDVGRPEEQPRLPMGEEGNAAAPAQGSAR